MNLGLQSSVLNQANKLGGMHILFSRDENSSGVKLLISPPRSYVTHFTDIFSIIPDFDNFFQIYIRNEILTNAFQKLPLKSRRCVLPGDMEDLMYLRSRCVLICIAEEMYTNCGCHLYFIQAITLKSKTHRDCTFKDLLCFKNQTGKREIS